MSQRPSRAGIILKDLREFSRDRLWMLLTPLALIWVVVTFWILPASVDESITVGLHPDSVGHLFQTLAAGESDDHALKVVPFDQEERLVAAVTGELEDDEEVTIGIAFPDDFVSSVRAGKATQVTVYVEAAVPAEVRRAVSSGIRELAYGLQAAMALKNPASALPVTLPEAETIVVGDDRAGAGQREGERLSLQGELHPDLDAGHADDHQEQGQQDDQEEGCSDSDRAAGARRARDEAAALAHWCSPLEQPGR